MRAQWFHPRECPVCEPTRVVPCPHSRDARATLEIVEWFFPHNPGEAA